MRRSGVTPSTESGWGSAWSGDPLASTCLMPRACAQPRAPSKRPYSESKLQFSW